MEMVTPSSVPALSGNLRRPGRSRLAWNKDQPTDSARRTASDPRYHGGAPGRCDRDSADCARQSDRESALAREGQFRAALERLEESRVHIRASPDTSSSRMAARGLALPTRARRTASSRAAE